MTEHTGTNLIRKRKSGAEKRTKVRLCLLGFLMLSGCGALLFYGDRLPVFIRILSWQQQKNSVEVAATVPPFIRGNIYDRNLRPLAATYKTYAVCARPLEMDDPDNTAGVLADLLGLKKSQLLKELKSERGFIWIAKGITPETAEMVKRQKIKGIYQVVETNRLYPNGSTAAHAVGFVEYGQGLDGIEFQYNSLLRGEEMTRAELTALNLDSPTGLEGARTHLALNLDLILQAKIEDYLEERIHATGASGGTAILMNADTGALWALASFPTFNPNRYWEFPSTTLKNHALTEPVFPGELTRIIQQAAAITIKMEERNDQEETPDGITALTVLTPEKQKRRRFSAAPQADYVEPGYLAWFVRHLGLGLKPATDLPLKDEVQATLDLALDDASFQASALRLLHVFTSLVNGGVPVTPHLLYGAYQGDNFIPFQTSRDLSEIEPVIDPVTGTALKDFLAAKWLNLKNGLRPDTPMFLESNHYSINPAGPTGQESTDSEKTTNIRIPYLTQTVMLGAIPGREPKMTMIAVLTYPDGQDGADFDVQETPEGNKTILAPDREMIRKVMDIAAMEPPKPAPGFWDTELTMLARNSNGEPVEQLIRAAMAEDLEKTMPDVTGKSLRAGLQALQHLNLEIKLVGGGRIVAQHPQAGTRLADISECVLELRREI